MNETKTPRTDAARLPALEVSAWVEVVTADFARTLERELQASQAATKRAEEERDEAKGSLANALANRAFDRGPWYAGMGETSPERAYIASDDFTHDVRLYVNGDFASMEQRLAYAREIAQRLNERDAAQSEVARLLARVAELERDAERLSAVETLVEEWGECWFQLIRWYDDTLLFQLCYDYDSDDEPLRYSSVRAAIDAAMSASGVKE